MSLPVSTGVAQRIGSTILFFLSVFSIAACVKRLPPAATPEPVVPAINSTTGPAEGQGRLVVDVVDGPTSVQRVQMMSQPIGDDQGRVRYRFSESSEPLCSASPCVLDVPVGNVLLGFPVVGDSRAQEVELVHVGAEATVYRRSLSYYNGRTGSTRTMGILATIFGGTSMTAGAALLPIGLSKEIDGLTIAGAVSLGVGTGLLALGIWAIRSDAPTYRPGSSLHFPLPSP